MKISYAILYTNDLEKTVSFYKDLVGLELESHDQGRFASFKLENGSLGIKQKKEEREIPGHQSVIVSTTNIEDLYHQYKNKDVFWYKELTKEEWGTNFAILDPDGNKIEFVGE